MVAHNGGAAVAKVPVYQVQAGAASENNGKGLGTGQWQLLITGAQDGLQLLALQWLIKWDY